MNGIVDYESLVSNYGEALATKILLISAISAFTMVLGFFILKAIAVCRMAKRKGYKYWWLGMIPYANFIVLGKLAGPVRIFKIDISNIGIFVLISSAILDIINLLNLLSGLILGFFPGLAYALYLIYSLSYIVELVFYIGYFSLAYSIFGKYAPQKRMLFTVLSLIQPLFSILLIVIMNNHPYSSVDEYYRELMAKRYGQAYDPHSSPYQTHENPFSDYSNGQQSNKKPVDNPFEEYDE